MTTVQPINSGSSAFRSLFHNTSRTSPAHPARFVGLTEIELAGHSASSIEVATPVSSNWIQTVRPVEVSMPTKSLSREARKALGDNASDRFDRFLEYEHGWDGGRGRAMSAASVAALEYFLCFHPTFPTEPSLFLTTSGALQLAWEDTLGASIEIDFLDSEIAYFVEASEAEGRIPVRLDSVRSITNLLETAESE